jgi:dipeptidyl aminopeptidase/acylaminoacyl peptidase
MRNLLLSAAFIVLTVLSKAQTGQDPVKVTDMVKIKSLGSIALNSEGTMAAFTVNSIEPEADSKWDYKYVTHLYVVHTDGSSSPKQLTIRESSSQPAWSPDGEQLAFVRSVDGKSQIFILPVNGGEPIQFTHFRYGASSPKWSPDGRKILFAANISLKDLLKDSSLNAEYNLPKWPFEQPGFERNSSLLLPVAKADPDGNLDEIRAWLDGNIIDKKAKVLNKLNFQDEQNVTADLQFTHYFAQSMEPNAQPMELTHGFYSFSMALFTPDGKRLILTADLDSSVHPDRSLDREIFVADSNGNHLKLFLGEPGKVFDGASISPSGNFLAYMVSPALSESVPELLIASLNKNDTQRIRIPFDRSKSGLTWSPDEKYLYFTAGSNGGVPLYRFDMTTRNVEQLSDFSSGIGSFDLKGGRLVYVKTETENPFEMYSSDLSMSNSRRLTHFNSDWIAAKKISLPEKHSFRNNAGMTVEYWVMKPANFTTGRKYPLLLEIHGGPAGMWGPGESTMWHEFQVFCSKGFGVVYANPRGSSGYGGDFQRAIINDWGAGPSSDVLTALDSCISEGWADTSRLLISGGSYGGYLVTWTIAHDHRFLAACAQRGVYDLFSFFGEGNAWRLVPIYFGGYPWEPAVKKVLERESPISYVQDITTPLIIFHGENDRRTGFVQSEMMFRSLKVLNRPVEYVRHPGATHEITRSGDNRQRMDQMLRTYEFFERWVKKPHFKSK